MRAVVTGGAGFIGSHVVDLLLEEGHEVAVVDNLSTGRVANLDPRAVFYRMDIADTMLRDVIATVEPDVVFHQAAPRSAKVSTDDLIRDARMGLLGLVNLLEACVASGVRKVVFASSGATYGDPVYLPMDEQHPQRPESADGLAKMMSERYLGYYAEDRGLSYVALRYGSVYGPRQSLHGKATIALLARQLYQRQTPTMPRESEQVQDYVYVRDVARANLLAAGRGERRSYCIGTGRGTSAAEIYRLVCQVTGAAVEPGRVSRSAGSCRAAYLDPGRARADLGWEAEVPLEVGLRLTVDALRREGPAPMFRHVEARAAA